MKTISVDYQSLMIVILVSTFGLLLVVIVKQLILILLVLVLFIQELICLLLLTMTITVNQVQWIRLMLIHITLMILYGMEQDVQRVVVVVMTLLSPGSFIN